MNFLLPDWKDAPPAVGALSTCRQGGVSRFPYDDGTGGGGLNLGVHVGDRLEDVQRNRALLRTHLPAEPAWLTQVHGTAVIDAASAVGAPQADASIADRPGVVCAIQTADCLPVLFCDAGGRVVGAAHAGWRGLAGGILQNTVARMREAGAGDVIAWLGPAIGPACFEVGEDVRTAFAGRTGAFAEVSEPSGAVGPAGAFRPRAGSPGKYLADIYRLARAALTEAGGVTVHGGGLCTVTDRARFYSYRRDRETGRMASLIWLG